MTQPGMGVMLGRLSGNSETVAAYHAAMGRSIDTVTISNDRYGDGACILAFTDGSELVIRDDGRSCCESRYIVCDDDLSSFSGAKLAEIALREGPDEPDEWGGNHETQFCDVKTDRGDFTLCTHNEHNGYYGGFWIVLEFAASVDRNPEGGDGTAPSQSDESAVRDSADAQTPSPITPNGA